MKNMLLYGKGVGPKIAQKDQSFSSAHKLLVKDNSLEFFPANICILFTDWTVAKNVNGNQNGPKSKDIKS